MLLQPAKHGLKYVMPSEPQTGAYSWILQPQLTLQLPVRFRWDRVSVGLQNADRTSFSAAHVWQRVSVSHIYVSGSSSPLPGGVRDIDSAEIDALTAHNEQRGEAKKRHTAANHGKLCCFSCTQFQLLYDVATKNYTHTCTWHNDQTYTYKHGLINTHKTSPTECCDQMFLYLCIYWH